MDSHKALRLLLERLFSCNSSYRKVSQAGTLLIHPVEAVNACKEVIYGFKRVTVPLSHEISRNRSGCPSCWDTSGTAIIVSRVFRFIVPWPSVLCFACRPEKS